MPTSVKPLATTSTSPCTSPASSTPVAPSVSAPLWIEDPLTVRYSEAWRELKCSTLVPLLAGEKVETVDGFRPHLDNQVLDTIHPDVSYSSGITAGRQIVGYASLTRTAIGLYSGPSPSMRPRRTSSRWKMRSAPSVEMKKRWRKAPRPAFGKASSPSPKDLG
jgi:hypothetical protein